MHAADSPPAEADFTGALVEAARTRKSWRGRLQWLLERITAPGDAYAPAFVKEFQVFHGELQEFFNATALEGRLRSVSRSSDQSVAEAVTGFLDLKAKNNSSMDHLLSLLERLTALRQ